MLTILFNQSGLRALPLADQNNKKLWAIIHNKMSNADNTKQARESGCLKKE